jgi:hypothetical protein
MNIYLFFILRSFTDLDIKSRATISVYLSRGLMIKTKSALKMKGGWSSREENFSSKRGRMAHIYSYGLKEHLAMASSNKFSENFLLLFPTQ